MQNKRENLVRFPDSLTDGYLLKLVDDSVEKYAFFVPPNTSKEKETERGERECGKVTNKRKCGVLSAQIDGAYAAEHWLLGPQMQEQCPSTSLAGRTSCCVNYPARKMRINNCNYIRVRKAAPSSESCSARSNHAVHNGATGSLCE